MTSLVLNKANKFDVDKIYDLVNEAYKVEIGSDGVQYKNCDKFTLRDHARKHLQDMIVLRQNKKVILNFLKLIIVM